MLDPQRRLLLTGRSGPPTGRKGKGGPRDRRSEDRPAGSKRCTVEGDGWHVGSYSQRLLWVQLPRVDKLAAGSTNRRAEYECRAAPPTLLLQATQCAQRINGRKEGTQRAEVCTACLPLSKGKVHKVHTRRQGGDRGSAAVPAHTTPTTLGIWQIWTHLAI